MSLLTANSVPVIGGSILMPLNGAWTADIVIDQPDGSGFDAGTSVTLFAQDGFQLVGTVVTDRTGSFLDAVHVRLVGGAGGMLKTVTPRGYAQPAAFARDVLSDLASGASEKLSDQIDASLLSTNLVAWAVAQGTTTQALATFLAFVAPAANWRFLADGSLWLGVETWPSSSIEFDLLESDPKEGTAELGIVSPSIMPGVFLSGVGNVNRVEHTLSEDGVRSHVWVDLPGAPRGTKAAIVAIVDEQLAAVDYFGLYECKVLAQSADFSTVDVQPLPPVDAKLSGLQRVEVRAGTGVTVQFAPGAKVLLGWKGGDPRAPYVVPGLGGDAFISWTLGSSPDNVATKADITAVLDYVAGLTYAPGPGAATSLTVTVPPPTVIGSQTVKVQR